MGSTVLGGGLSRGSLCLDRRHALGPCLGGEVVQWVAVVPSRKAPPDDSPERLSPTQCQRLVDAWLAEGTPRISPIVHSLKSMLSHLEIVAPRFMISRLMVMAKPCKAEIMILIRSCWVVESQTVALSSVRTLESTLTLGSVATPQLPPNPGADK